jgi:hypothetical protein
MADTNEKINSDEIGRLQEQLAAAHARIVDLESENANKHRVDELLFKANARIASLEDTVNKAGILLKRDEAALQKCANAYGKWEGSNMDPNEAIGWVGNYTRAAGFKPMKEGER